MKICCVKCGKELTRKYKEISCQELDFVHGKDCNCYLTIGDGCYRKLKKELSSQKEHKEKS